MAWRTRAKADRASDACFKQRRRRRLESTFCNRSRSTCRRRRPGIWWQTHGALRPSFLLMALAEIGHKPSAIWKGYWQRSKSRIPPRPS